MCEATAYVLKNGQEELVLKDVDVIEPDGDSVRIVNIFGEQKVLKAEIRQPEPDRSQGHRWWRR